MTLPELLGLPDESASAAAPPAAAISSITPSRSVDRPGREGSLGPDGRPGPARAPVAAITAGGQVAVPIERGEAAPAHRVPTADPSPPARDAAWARRDGMRSTVALLTAALLVIILAGAALAGRRRLPEDDAAV